MKVIITWTAAILALALLAGCATPPERALDPPTADPPARHSQKQNYSLLFDLMNDEKNLSKLLIIKNESRELRELVQAISNRAKTAVDQMLAFARADGSLDVNNT